MNFTRDPIIETVITPKEGFKLLVRPSGGSGDEYQVDALEVVSFGKANFFRSLEKPKAFLLPVSDYEIIEIKETRVVLKKASIEKPIKIAGGKRPVPKPEPRKEEPVVEQETEEKEEEPKKGRKRKKSRSRKGIQERREEKQQEDAEPPPPRKMRALIPPPSALIADSISKYKEAITTSQEMLPEGVEGSTTGGISEEPSQEEEGILEEYHPHEDETIDQTILPEQNIDEDDPLLKHREEED